MRLNVFLTLLAGSVSCLSPVYAEDKEDVLDNWFKVGAECMKKLQSLLEEVVDQASANKAAPEIRTMNEKILKLAGETSKSYKTPSEFECAVMKKADKLQEVIAMGQKMEQENERIVKAKYFESEALKNAMNTKDLAREVKKTVADEKSTTDGKKS